MNFEVFYFLSFSMPILLFRVFETIEQISTYLLTFKEKPEDTAIKAL